MKNFERKAISPVISNIDRDKNVLKCLFHTNKPQMEIEKKYHLYPFLILLVYCFFSRNGTISFMIILDTCLKSFIQMLRFPMCHRLGFDVRVAWWLAAQECGVDDSS